MPYNGYFMGSIIKEDTQGEPSAALTKTGKGRLFSQGYLRDAPAEEYLGDRETPVFVILDDEAGIERIAEDERVTIEPGAGYRAITVVTDRRILLLVGNAADGGDKRITLPFVETSGASAVGDSLMIAMRSGISWRCHAGDSGIDSVAAYIDRAGDTWRDVEATLDSVKRSIVAATSDRDAGNYDAALTAMGGARDDLEEIQERVDGFEAQWPGTALTERVEHLRDRCLARAADIKVGYARATVDRAETHWRQGEYERAREAFMSARRAYDAVGALPARYRTDVENVDQAIERLDRSLSRLDDAPLRSAIDADRRAREAEPGLATLEALEEARERYGTVLELESAVDDRAFAGDRDRIREQREAVTDRYVDTALDVGSDALEAGQWYSETGQTELAITELTQAIQALDRGLTVAESERPPAAERLRATRSEATALLATVRRTDEHDEDHADEIGSAVDREPGGLAQHDSTTGQEAPTPPAHSPVDTRTAAAADGGSNVVGTTTASPDEPDDGRAASSAGEPDESEPARSAVAETALDDRDPDAFDSIVRTVIEALGWEPESTASAACDYLANGAAGGGAIAVRSYPNTNDEPLTPERIRECAELAQSVPGVDRTVLLTTRPLTVDALDTAATRDLTILDRDAIATILAQDVPVDEQARRRLLDS